MKKKILGLLIAMFMGIQVYASISVAPTKIELNANKFRNNYATTAIEIKGDTQRPMRFKAYTGYFEVSEDSKMIMMDSNTDNPHNIAKNVRFVPSEFTIPPGKSQKVRINIANIKTIPDGESRAVLYIEDVNAKEINVPNNMGIGAQLVLKTRVGVPVYVDKGKFTKIADVEYFKVVKDKNCSYTEMKVLSTGNSKIRYSGVIQVIQGKKLIDEYPIEGKVVGQSNYYIAKDRIQSDKIKDGEEYTLRLVLTYFDQENNRKNIKKDVILNKKEDI